MNPRIWRAPPAFTNVTYTLFPRSSTNNTHWRVVGLCRGCSQWKYPNGTIHTLDQNNDNLIAWATSLGKPSNPSSNTSSFPQHDDQNYFVFDFRPARAKITDFVSAVQSLGNNSAYTKPNQG